MMKRLLCMALILTFALSGCNKEKDIEQIPFKLKRIATLIEKSSAYIRDASPGTIDEEDDDYLYFLLEDEIEDIDRAYIFYDFLDNKCDYIIIFSNYLDVLENAESLMNLVEDEIGKGLLYYLEYDDTLSVIQEKSFNSCDSLWHFVSNNSISVESVNEVASLHHYDEYYFFSGGVYNPDKNYFMSLIEIGLWDELNLKSAASAESYKESIRLRFKAAIHSRIAKEL